jgi:ankyrin repeat protein
MAALEGHAETVRVLVELGCDVNGKADGKDSLCTPLHLAAFTGSLDTVKVLVGLGANTQAQAANGSTPSRIAIDRGNQEAIDFFRTGLKKATHSRRNPPLRRHPK